MKIKQFLPYYFCVFSSLLFLCSFGQTQESKSNDYDTMSLKDLLNVRIVSVSKSSELLFDAPLSASVVTKNDIRKAGCTSIMEALRLVPGIIVREQTNGNYDIQIRGVYTTPNALFDGASATLLVMIDNRTIFNYLKGSTFWETLPVDLNDIEKIEVIRGPAAALYGPNAVTGVINIITRQAEKKGLYLIGNSSQGSRHSFINNASVGYRTGKWSGIASANYQHRARTQSSYFELNRNQWVEPSNFLVSAINDTIYNMNGIYPDPELAMEKYAGNVFIGYKPSDAEQYKFNAGAQHSFAQKVSAENGVSPLTAATSNTSYADLQASIKGFSAQVSYLKGYQAPDHQQGNQYDFSTFDAVAGYNYKKGNFSLKPGVSYRSASYDDTKYADVFLKTGMFNAHQKIVTFSGYLRSEYKLLDNKLRLVAGTASSSFNYPDTTYLSYEFAATYKLNKKHLFRVAYSKAPRSSSIYDTYIDQNISRFQTGYQKYLTMQYEGNKNLKLLTAGMFELGYRGTIAPKLFLDAEVFYMDTKNYSLATLNATYVKLIGSDTVITVPLIPTNLPMTASQQGITLSLTWQSKQLEIKPFVTVQHSIVKDYAPYANTPDASPGFLQPDPVTNNIYSGIGTKEELKTAPKIFGGFSTNYSFSSRFNINLNAYYYSAQTIYHATKIVFNDGVRGIDHISSKLIINTAINYHPVKELHVFISGKNILNNRSREFFRTDYVPAMFLAGVSYEF